MEREISEVKIYSKSLRKYTWRRRKALLLMEGKGDMSEQAIVSEEMKPVNNARLTGPY